MKRFLPLLALVLLVVAGPVGPVLAQSIDVEQIRQDVLDADVDDLITALQLPISDSMLPKGFNAPEDAVAANQDLVDAFSQGLDDIEGIEASISHGIDLDRQVIDFGLGTGILTALVYDQEIGSRDFDVFAESLRDAFSDSTDMEGEVTEVTIAGVDAAHVSTVDSGDGFFLDIEIYVLPVGNVMLVGTILVGDTVEVDPAVISPFAADLTLAGVGWIAKAAGSSEAPDDDNEEDPMKDKFGMTPSWQAITRPIGTA